MPCYNMESYVADSIASVQWQTYPHWELLIVDDASTDGTVETVKKLAEQDEKIHFAVKNEHSGIADTRNQCIQMAQGRFLAFLDADDIWHPEKIETQLRFMSDRNAGFTYTTYDWIDEEGRTLNKFINTIGNLDYKSYLRNTIIGCSTVMLDRNIVGEVVVPDYRTSQDTATWLNLMKKGFVAYDLDQMLVHYRVRRNSNSSNKFDAARDLWQVYRDQGLSLPKTLFCFACYVFNAIKKRL